MPKSIEFYFWVTNLFNPLVILQLACSKNGTQKMIPTDEIYGDVVLRPDILQLFIISKTVRTAGEIIVV